MVATCQKKKDEPGGITDADRQRFVQGPEALDSIRRSLQDAITGTVPTVIVRVANLWACVYMCLSVMYRENGGRCRECRLCV